MVGKMIEEIDEVLHQHGYPLSFRDVCEMFYDQGMIDCFLHDGFDEYFDAVMEGEDNVHKG